MKTVLKNKLFLTTFVADAISNFGDTLYYLALMNYVLLLPNSQLAISAVTLSETLPMLFSFAMGIKADQTKKKLEMIMGTLVLRVGLYSLIGFFMGFEPSLWVVLAASTINFISDLAGQYENGLYSPISLRVIKAEEREQAMAFRQSSFSLLSIVFKFSGALLIAVMSYQHLAFFNAATFAVAALIMLVIKPKLTALLIADPIKDVEAPIERQNFLVQMWESSKLVIREIKQIPALRTVMTIIPLLNAVFSGLDVLFLFAASQNTNMIIVNLPFTLTLISAAAMSGQIIGGMLTMSVAKNWEVTKLVRLSALAPALLFLGLLLGNTYLMIAVLFVTMVNVGIVNPKMNALIMNELPEERLATISSGISTYFTAGILLVRLLLSGLVLVLAPTPLALLFLIASIALVIWTFFGNSRA
ncbi:MFS transporter [Streptococcus entericus]|uniref:MFS transporter n=1 Tax=Streptococcus entericus TaxID=155680 RepID=UPI000379D961|nr:MFS transporter [Streptococcus entericus]